MVPLQPQVSPTTASMCSINSTPMSNGKKGAPSLFAALHVSQCLTRGKKRLMELANHCEIDFYLHPHLLQRLYSPPFGHLDDLPLESLFFILNRSCMLPVRSSMLPVMENINFAITSYAFLKKKLTFREKIYIYLSTFKNIHIYDFCCLIRGRSWFQCQEQFI